MPSAWFSPLRASPPLHGSLRLCVCLLLSLRLRAGVSLSLSSVFLSLSLCFSLFLSFSNFLFLCPFWCSSISASQCPPRLWPSALVFLSPSLPVSPSSCKNVLPTNELSPASGLRALLSLALCWVFRNCSISHVLLWKMFVSLYSVVAVESTAPVTGICCSLAQCRERGALVLGTPRLPWWAPAMRVNPYKPQIPQDLCALRNSPRTFGVETWGASPLSLWPPGCFLLPAECRLRG